LYIRSVKIAVVRFSSIGDVVLTTPIVRCLKQQLPDATLHFITKENFSSILCENPYIDRLITIRSSIQEVMTDLKREKYDWVIDLHKNVRTLSLKQKLKVPSRSFPKMNLEKWMLVKFKINKMPSLHIVDRYFETVKHLGVKKDDQPCDFFLSASSHVSVRDRFSIGSPFIAIAIGAQYATKRMPVEKLIEIITSLTDPIILLGSSADASMAKHLIDHFPSKNIQSACGDFSLPQSASIVQQAAVLLTNDTGMMHIASCFQVPTVSVWGNTVPAFGMFPYFPANPNLFSIHEVPPLSCRPCSKIGFQTCPKKHFHCMTLHNSTGIALDIQSRMGPVKEVAE
jgi:ADP-heptose:LPS heptosyltransferase